LLDKTHPIPLYYQVKESLLEEIRAKAVQGPAT
jgi:hypothetical protein